MNIIKSKLLLVGLLIPAVVLSSCDKGGGTVGSMANSQSASEEAGQEVTLKFFFSGDKKSATDEVWSAVSDYVKSKGLNVRFDIHFIPIGDYKNKMLVMAAAGDRWDMNFDADWLSYKQMAAKGAYMRLNELLPSYAPHLYSKYKQQNNLEAATLDGSIVGLPWMLKMSQRLYAQWRSDMTKKAGINPAPDSIQTIEDIDVLLHAFKKAYPNVKLTRTLPRDIYKLRDEWVDLGFHGMGFYINDPKVRIQPIEQQPFYMEAAIMARKWYADGILNKDTMIDKEDGAVLWRGGNMYFTSQSHEWVHANQGFTDPSFEQESSLLYPDKNVVNRTSLANVVAINRNSAHPDLVLRFLDMLETDQALYDLVQYGIKGKTYVLDGEAVSYPQGLNTSTSNYMEWGGQWSLWKPQFMRPTPTYGKDFWVKEAEFAGASHNVDSPIDGLFLSEDKIKNELLARDRLIEKWTGPIEIGSVLNPKEAVAAYIQKQKESGLDAIIAQAQRQIDIFLAKRKLAGKGG
ncbi:extracellular solute-binding protein [Paenibacillus solisilvae]|uniref:Extracellular solute-binding protein n=1 Tax=Paenibacillus solisilvae TaxID=2486751 RepID=A0ABW0VU97_9BACL